MEDLGRKWWNRGRGRERVEGGRERGIRGSGMRKSGWIEGDSLGEKEEREKHSVHP